MTFVGLGIRRGHGLNGIQNRGGGISSCFRAGFCFVIAIKNDGIACIPKGRCIVI